mmetsp:Transcript_92972/g.233716  ORF Transcript_92972/g.233716 Transcript_92972/m.233716 type:complete len:237 (+) Transcript_92972:166-876(+)
MMEPVPDCSDPSSFHSVWRPSQVESGVALHVATKLKKPPCEVSWLPLWKSRRKPCMAKFLPHATLCLSKFQLPSSLSMWEGALRLFVAEISSRIHVPQNLFHRKAALSGRKAVSVLTPKHTKLALQVSASVLSTSKENPRKTWNTGHVAVNLEISGISRKSAENSKRPFPSNVLELSFVPIKSASTDTSQQVYWITKPFPSCSAFHCLSAKEASHFTASPTSDGLASVLRSWHPRR